MTTLIIQITVPVSSDDVVEQAAVLNSFHEALINLKSALPEGSQCVSRFVNTRSADARPAGRKPTAPNGAEARQQPSA